MASATATAVQTRTGPPGMRPCRIVEVAERQGGRSLAGHDSHHTHGLNIDHIIRYVR